MDSESQKLRDNVDLPSFKKYHKKGMKSCKQARNIPQNHFVGTDKMAEIGNHFSSACRMVEIGSLTKREVN